DEKLTRRTQPLIDVETAIERGVVDKTFPADRCTRLFEVDPHDDFKFACVAIALFAKSFRVVKGRGRVVDRTWTDHGNDTIVSTSENGLHIPTRSDRRRGDVRGTRALARHVRRGGQLRDFADS